jgi:hypothetical protein
MYELLAVQVNRRFRVRRPLFPVAAASAARLPTVMTDFGRIP